MVAEAEAHAAEDEKRKEEAEVRNIAEQQVYSIDKLLNENADKLDDSVVSDVREANDKVRTALEGEDIEAIKAAQEALNQKAQKIGEALYAQAQAEAAAAGETAGAESTQNAAPADDDVVDAEIVDDETDNK